MPATSFWLQLHYIVILISRLALWSYSSCVQHAWHANFFLKKQCISIMYRYSTSVRLWPDSGILWLAFYFPVRFKKYFLVFTVSSDSAEHDNKSYLHFNLPWVIHLSDANVHVAAAIMDPKPYSTLVQKKLRARKAPLDTFPRVGMYVRSNIFHHSSRVLNQLKPITKVMDICVWCLQPVRREIIPAPWQFLTLPELPNGSSRPNCDSDTVS